MSRRSGYAILVWLLQHVALNEMNMFELVNVWFTLAAQGQIANRENENLAFFCSLIKKLSCSIELEISKLPRRDPTGSRKTSNLPKSTQARHCVEYLVHDCNTLEMFQKYYHIGGKYAICLHLMLWWADTLFSLRWRRLISHCSTQ